MMCQSPPSGAPFPLRRQQYDSPASFVAGPHVQPFGGVAFRLQNPSVDGSSGSASAGPTPTSAVTKRAQPTTDFSQLSELPAVSPADALIGRPNRFIEMAPVR